MTEYKEGVWYGWNGGECPVHPNTEVVVKWSSNGVETETLPARIFDYIWGGRSIAAFKIVRENREPREWWIIPGTVHTPFSAIYYGTKPQVGAVRVREVLDDEGGV